MTARVRNGFQLETVVVKLDALIPTKLVTGLVSGAQYKAIAASVREVGIIEPLVVFPEKKDRYLLLDGHVRLAVLRELGAAEVACLVSTDDESYSYNNRVNRVAPIQVNRMILRAIEAGAPEERIAKALNVTIRTVRDSQTTLAGICPEAIDLLKDKPITGAALRALKSVKPMRQMSIAELMVASGVYSRSYADALLAGTPKDELTSEAAAKRSEVMKPEDAAKLDSEMSSIEREFLVMHEAYGRNLMELTVAVAYLRKIFENVRVVRFLTKEHAEVFGALQKVAEAASLDGTS